MSEIKAVLFDYGNVLCNPQEKSDHLAMAECLGMSVEEFEPLYWQFRDEYDLGTADGAAYWSKVASNAMKEISKTQIMRLIEIDSLSWSRPNHDMANWVRTLTASGYTTAVISNMPLELHKHILDKCTWLPIFDQYTFSCSLKTMKPAADIFMHCLDSLSLKPSQALFLDDRITNIDGAKSLGMHALLFTDVASLSSQTHAFGLPPVSYK